MDTFDGFLAGLIAFFVIFIGLIFYIAGIPRTEYSQFEGSMITCKKWTEHWSWKLDQSKCFEMKEVGNDY